ncbi:MAG: ATP-binding cassette domain-containing protein, partial [Anaerovorax sp.]
GQRLSLVTARPIVEIAGLSKKFKEVQALNDISMEIPKGKIIGLLGPNGSGKTTLLKILAGMYASYEGSVLINGERPSHVTKAEVAYLPDKNSCAKEMSVADVLKIYEVFFEDFNPEKCGELLER